MSQSKRMRRQSIRGSQAGAKKKRRADRAADRPMSSIGTGGDSSPGVQLDFLVAGAADALRRSARALDREPTALDEDDGISDFASEFENLVDELGQLDELLATNVVPRYPHGDGAHLLAARRAETERLGGRKFDDTDIGLDPFDALDLPGRIALLSTDMDRAMDVVGLMLARGTDWDPLAQPASGPIH